MSAPGAALRLYRGTLIHERRRPPCYRFRYRVFSLLADIDRLDEAAATRRLFSHNRFNLLALHDRDHGPKDGSPLRPWIDAQLAEAGVDLAGGRVELLCYPRVLGYVFNPLSVWFCRHADGRLRAVLCEVRNTFGEWHGYLLHDGGAPLPEHLRDQAPKRFHVSPFLPREGHYRFRFSAPGERYSATVNWHDDADPEHPALIAVQFGSERPAGDAGLLWAALAVPLMTLKVIAAIHWQALKIWLRGGRFHRKPAPPATEISR
ncbi:DUF1365 domain-containing protein [Sediminicurvatus halobius]|uniref:DUF1365 domain-containing protein n=1 Tax=Sediminicurvatus halobius TaxID=2182432 RepID=A0A2U2MWN7_9GAMM|nr:DUF1365 domain-containing protein [Spiribacter halobius]PWG61273.1 DUF1365 domain-containing protein [Spiribacter halobius]UEX78418.1 DUF1365 domain-containing protein [Spiribacter halobius]